MHKSFLCGCAMLLAFSGGASAMTVFFSAGASSRIVTDSSSTQLAAGDLVMVGTFSSSGVVASNFNSSASVQTNFNNIASAAGWNQFGYDTSGNFEATSFTLTTTSSVGSMRIGGQVTDNTGGATHADFFDNQQIYLWVFNSSSISTATEMGIYTAPPSTGANPSWNFPATVNTVGNPAYGTSTTTAPTMNALVGNASSTQLSLAAEAAVPEPSTWVSLIGATGFLAMLRRRRTARS